MNKALFKKGCSLFLKKVRLNAQILSQCDSKISDINHANHTNDVSAYIEFMLRKRLVDGRAMVENDRADGLMFMHCGQGT